ncbi:hypothetical protein DFS34DRAFT_259851 [Phlyctochytrium arcticum]|nr:hypothetical protein DFS34DRAFT_259851 [Phlyctochytrium arcticum]
MARIGRFFLLFLGMLAAVAASVMIAPSPVQARPGLPGMLSVGFGAFLAYIHSIGGATVETRASYATLTTPAQSSTSPPPRTRTRTSNVITRPPPPAPHLPLILQSIWPGRLRIDFRRPPCHRLLSLFLPNEYHRLTKLKFGLLQEMPQ